MLRMGGLDRLAVAVLQDRYGLVLRMQAPGQLIPGSYWGESEAGLIGRVLYARSDTPLHSVLHEAAHFICMSPERRAGLDTNAGGDDAEECAVCYLQLLLAMELPQCGFARACQDMDDWGYSFRLGSTRAWFEQDAGDARLWLLAEGLVDVPESRAVFAGCSLTCGSGVADCCESQAGDGICRHVGSGLAASQPVWR